MDPYRSFLLGISDELTRKEVEKLTYVFRIPKGHAEKIESGTDLFGYLEERALLKPGKFDELRDPLLTIKRLDLVHKIDDYVGSQSNAGIQESESGESSKSESHVDMRKFRSHCEKNGYGVKVVDGNHFSQNNSYFVELKLGNMFHVELSNSNNHGCTADVRFTRHDGSKQETLGIRLEECHGKVTVYGSPDVPFAFNMEGTSTSSGSSTKQFLEITFNPGEYIIFFHTREVEQNSKSIFSEVMKVCIPKVNEIKVGEVLQRLQEEYPNVAGSCFNYGQKILGAEELLRLPLENHSENNPLLLMKQSERIAVKEVDNSKQYIHVDPLQSNLEAFKQQVCHLYKYESCELRIDGKVLDAWVDCFKGNCVEVTKKSSPPSGYRGSAPTRKMGLHSRKTSPFGSRYCEDEFEDELAEIVGDLKMKPKEEVFSRSQGKETKKTLSRLGEASTSELKVVASSEDKMVICPDDKVVIRIYLVPSSTSPAS